MRKNRSVRVGFGGSTVLGDPELKVLLLELWLEKDF